MSSQAQETVPHFSYQSNLLWHAYYLYQNEFLCIPMHYHLFCLSAFPDIHLLFLPHHFSWPNPIYPPRVNWSVMNPIKIFNCSSPQVIVFPEILLYLPFDYVMPWSLYAVLHCSSFGTNASPSRIISCLVSWNIFPTVFFFPITSRVVLFFHCWKHTSYTWTQSRLNMIIF